MAFSFLFFSFYTNYAFEPLNSRDTGLSCLHWVNSDKMSFFFFLNTFIQETLFLIFTHNGSNLPQACCLTWSRKKTICYMSFHWHLYICNCLRLHIVNKPQPLWFPIALISCSASMPLTSKIIFLTWRVHLWAVEILTLWQAGRQMHLWVLIWKS